MIEEGRASQE